jgi:hypothetical protein
MASLIMLVPFGNTNLFSNTAMAQGYDDKYYGDDSYSKYPTDNKNMNVEQVRLKDSS